MLWTSRHDLGGQIVRISMVRARSVAVASILFVVGTQSVEAQELSRYREYALGSTVASVVTLTSVFPPGGR